MWKTMVMMALAAVVWAATQNALAQRADEARPGPRPPRPAPAREGPPTAADETEAKILAVLQDMYQNQRQGMMNVPPEDGRLLRVLTEATNAKTVVEIGTSNGYSGIWFCLALRTTGGRLITHEIDARRAALARENFKRVGVSHMVTLVEGDAHVEVAKLKDPIDILFLDADKAGYIDYLNKLLPLVRPGGLVLGHNTATLASQMQDFIKAITENANLETVFTNMHAQGVSLTLKKRQVK